MQPPTSPPLALPPALTYLLARALADAERRSAATGVLSARRIEALLRDAVRHLAAGGASVAETRIVLHDVGEALAASSATPAVRAVLAELEQQAGTFALSLASSPDATTGGPAAVA